MKYLLSILCLFVLSCDNADLTLIEKLKSQDCTEYILSHSYRQIAEEIGDWEAAKNFKVRIWAKTSDEGKFPVLGEMKPQSRALILDRKVSNNGAGKIDYKILSPFDGSIGWINSIQVEKTLFRNPVTFEECNN